MRNEFLNLGVIDGDSFDDGVSCWVIFVYYIVWEFFSFYYILLMFVLVFVIFIEVVEW